MYDTKHHKSIMSNILLDIYSDKSIGQYLGFKGGTAAMLFYNLPRFSVDLDFNLLDVEKEQLVFEKMKGIISRHGEVVEEENKYNTLFFLVSYGKDQRKLKIEISKRQAEATENKYDLLDYFGVVVRVMQKEFMFAHKLVAITERKEAASRDLYDIDFFFKEGWSVKDEIIVVRTGKTVNEFLPFLINYIEENFTPLNILQGIGELLTTSQKDYARMRLKNDVLFRLKLFEDGLK